MVFPASAAAPAGGPAPAPSRRWLAAAALCALAVFAGAAVLAVRGGAGGGTALLTRKLAPKIIKARLDGKAFREFWYVEGAGPESVTEQSKKNSHYLRDKVDLDDIKKAKCITVFGHVDGFGSQYMAVLSGIIYAKMMGKEFRHTALVQLAHPETVLDLQDTHNMVARNTVNSKSWLHDQELLADVDRCERQRRHGVVSTLTSCLRSCCVWRRVASWGSRVTRRPGSASGGCGMACPGPNTLNELSGDARPHSSPLAGAALTRFRSGLEPGSDSIVGLEIPAKQQHGMRKMLRDMYFKNSKAQYNPHDFGLHRLSATSGNKSVVRENIPPTDAAPVQPRILLFTGSVVCLTNYH